MRRFTLLSLLALVALSACKDSTGSRAGPAARMDLVGGNAQTGTPGAELPQPVVVKVTDAKGRAVEGQVVNFVVTAGGGTVFAGTALTNDDGVAQERWTVGKVAGAPQTLEARAVDSSTGQALVFATFTAAVTSGTPANVAAVDGRTQTAGATGGPVAHPLAVLVTDAHGNPVPGVTVSWRVDAGNGTFAQPTSTTSAQGVAAAPVWTLGDGSLGTENAGATVQGLSTVVFTARVATVLQKTAGDGLTAGSGTVIPVAVRLAGPTGSIPGVPVTWTVAGGGGSVEAYTPASPQEGYAYARWTLGPAGGTQTLTAGAGALSATFSATAIGAGTRVPVAQVPGRVLDATASQVVWVDSSGGQRRIKLRSLPGGGDVVIKTDTAGGLLVTGGHIAGGAVLLWTFSRTTANVFEWRAGTLSLLGENSGSAPVADGDWALWVGNNGTRFFRRNLATGVTDQIVRTSGGPHDIAPNGEAVFAVGSHTIVRDLGGSQTTLATQGSGTSNLVYFVFADGVNVAYTLLNPSGLSPSNVSGWLVTAGGEEQLFTFPIGRTGAPWGILVEGGWTAWLANGGVGVRAPGGARSQAAPQGTAGELSALSPTGSVIWVTFDAPAATYRMRTAGGNLVDLGPVAFIPGDTERERVVWRGDRFLALLGGSVSELRP